MREAIKVRGFMPKTVKTARNRISATVLLVRDCQLKPGGILPDFYETQIGDPR